MGCHLKQRCLKHNHWGMLRRTTFDIEGIDAAHKITIIASIAFGVSLNFNDVFVEGISSLQLKDVTYAEELGYRIKLIG